MKNWLVKNGNGRPYVEVWSPGLTMVETIVLWYLQGKHQKPDFLRWCNMVFVHPQYEQLAFVLV